MPSLFFGLVTGVQAIVAALEIDILYRHHETLQRGVYREQLASPAAFAFRNRFTQHQLRCCVREPV